MSVLRAYDPNGKPAATPHSCASDAEGPKPASRCSSPAIPAPRPPADRRRSSKTLRDVYLPQWLLRASELRGRYIQFGKTSPEAHRIVEDPLNGLENSHQGAAQAARRAAR